MSLTHTGDVFKPVVYVFHVIIWDIPFGSKQLQLKFDHLGSFFLFVFLQLVWQVWKLIGYQTQVKFGS